jgi:hypothetical protein
MLQIQQQLAKTFLTILSLPFTFRCFPDMFYFSSYIGPSLDICEGEHVWIGCKEHTIKWSSLKPETSK